MCSTAQRTFLSTIWILYYPSRRLSDSCVRCAEAPFADGAGNRTPDVENEQFFFCSNVLPLHNCRPSFFFYTCLIDLDTYVVCCASVPKPSSCVVVCFLDQEHSSYVNKRNLVVPFAAARIVHSSCVYDDSSVS